MTLLPYDERDWRPGLRGPVIGAWLEPAWSLALEAGARRAFGDALSVEVDRERLRYRVALEVPGQLDLVDTSITFYARPDYSTYGLPAEEYPRVTVSDNRASPHRMPGDRALCLFFPHDPPEQRWTPANGLLTLINLTRDHLFFESVWRGRKGEWLGDQADHGFPHERTA